jgi:hypothetical protein
MSRNEALSREAEEWINSNDDGIFSFNKICGTLGFNPERVRAGLERWKAKQIEVPREERKRLLLSKEMCRVAQVASRVCKSEKNGKLTSFSSSPTGWAVTISALIKVEAPVRSPYPSPLKSLTTRTIFITRNQ